MPTDGWEDWEEVWARAAVCHLWVASSGVQWCFLWLDGEPTLACESDT